MKRDLPNATRYEDYNVMDQQEHWDDHTRSIVERRLELESRLQVFHPEKAACMQAICACIVDDYRPEIIGFIVQHIDQTLHQTIGESDRKVNVPEAKPLILAGLTAVEQTAILKRGKAFPSLAKTEQSSMLKERRSRGTGRYMGRCAAKTALREVVNHDARSLLFPSCRMVRDRLWRSGVPERVRSNPTGAA
ncbi:hypothetical protein FE782_16065 [Paenibacillus antri]|uniref:Uncharacterized protein n=1 Tax=Paenibacillus antri TaxID=2582848 RepID=A0A5R9GI93_9BACL|nr:hypothetical protein [Paenibacillus antri]TLS51245.1 hypothetical protein FE782_16065 [Paenibacillus antri]